MLRRLRPVPPAPAEAPGAEAPGAEASAEERRPSRFWPPTAAVLRVVAEAGWLTVLYACGSVLADKRAPAIGPLEMAAFVGVGVMIGATGRKAPTPGAILVICGVILGGAIGSLVGHDLETIVRDWPGILGVHFTGWLAGLAVLRGAVVSIGEQNAEQLERSLRFVPIGLGVLWAYATFAVRPELWLPFAVSAMWGTAMYLSGALVSIGIARLNLLHAELTDARQRLAWRWLVIAVGVGVVPLGVPVAVLAGVPLIAIMSPIVGPIQFLLTLLAYPLAFIMLILSILLAPVAGPFSDFIDELGRRSERVPQDVAASPELANALAALITAATLLLIVMAVFFTARWLLTRREDTVLEPDLGYSDIERAIVVPDDPKSPPRVRWRRRGRPRDAVGAYLSAIAELDLHGDLARQPAETPAAHAQRLRARERAGNTDLARLAAAYQLARYGARRITRLENLRAVGRFNRLRRLLRSVG